MADTSLIFNIIARDRASATFDKIKAGAAVAGAAIGVALAAGMAATIEKGNADALLAAQLGAGPEMAKEFGALSGKIYANNFGQNIGEVNNALKGVWQKGLVDEDAATADIQRVTEKVLTLGQVMVEDADKVSTAVAQMLKTGMAKSAEEAFDIIARGTQQGVNKSQDLLDTFNEYPTQFRKLGLDGTQAMGLLSQAIKGGARDSDLAADALKEFSLRAVNGSKLSAEGFRALGLDAGKMTAQIASGGPAAAAGLDTVLDRLRGIKDPVAQAAAATALFGTQSEDLGKALFSMDASTAVAQMGNVKGAAQQAADTLGGSAGAQLETFKRKAQMALVDQMAKAIPYITATFGWLAKNKDVVLPIAAALGVLATVIGVIVVATKIWTAVQAAFNIVMMMNPIGLVVLAIIAVIAIVVLCYMKFKWFRDAVDAVFRFIVAAAQLWWTGLQAYLNFLVAAFKIWWAAVKSYLNFLVNAFLWVKNMVLAYVRFMWTGLQKIWSGIGAGVTWLKNFIINGFNAWVGFITGLPGRIRSVASGMFDGIKNAFRSAINWLIDKWNGLRFGIPRIEVAGMSFGGQSFRVPQIPHLATGGNITGDGLAFVHRGETVTPAAQVTPLRGGSSTVRVVIDLTGADADLRRRLQKIVRVEGHGDVQVAFGRS